MNRGVGAIAVAVPVLLGISGTFDGSTPGGTSRKRLAKACEFSLASCPENGCTKVNSADALTNILKRRFPDGTRAKPITFDDLIELQDVAERTLPAGPRSGRLEVEDIDLGRCGRGHRGLPKATGLVRSV